MISALRQKSKFEFRTFLEKNQILGFPWCSTREGLSIDVSITNVGTDIDEAIVISAVRRKSKFEFQTFLEKKNQILEFLSCSTREDISIDVSVTNVRLILTKLWWFQLFVESQNSNFELFGKKIKFWGSHAVVLVKTFPLMYQLLM